MTDLDPDEFRRLGHAVVDWVAAYRAGLPDRPVRPDVAPGQVRSELPDLLPEHPQPLGSMLDAVDRAAVRRADVVVVDTEEQKAHYLPRILSGEQRWCQGYSEPEAGSDLAGIRTSAVLDGDEWVINGQKTWTSAGHLADHIFLLARTDLDVPKHRGITFLLVPMDQPGVEVRPIRNMDHCS